MLSSQKDFVKHEIILLYKEDVMEITGWGKNTVDDIFAHDIDFPAIKKGKKHQVELSAFKEYLSTRR
ncbi:MAG: hypothetical protein ACLSW4_04495 [Clostridia bacterium]